RQGLKLYQAYVDAGLTPPTMRLEAVIGGSEDPSGAVRDLIETLVPISLAHALEEFKVASAAEVGFDTLPQRLRDELKRNHSVIVGRSEIGVWSCREK
ncbi:MAG: hypothetical protein ACRENS_07930, partial [Candidatus Eiseniibacteriota bacterium]